MSPDERRLRELRASDGRVGCRSWFTLHLTPADCRGRGGGGDLKAGQGNIGYAGILGRGEQVWALWVVD